MDRQVSTTKKLEQSINTRRADYEGVITCLEEKIMKHNKAKQKLKQSGSGFFSSLKNSVEGLIYEYE